MFESRRNILIVGAGVNGLTCAYALQKKGYSTTLIADKIGLETTSSVAGALWELPPAVCGYPQHLSAEEISRDQKLSMISYHNFYKLSSNKKTGVSIRRANFYYEYDIRENAIENQKLLAAKEKLINFQHDAKIIQEHGVDPSLFKDAYAYDAPVIDTDEYLAWLLSLIDSCKNSLIVSRRIDGSISAIAKDLLDEFDAQLIINCSGLGSLQLANDLTVFGVRGGLIYVDNSGRHSKQINQAHCTSLSELGLSEGYFIFILPRGEKYLVLGGVAEVGKCSVNVSPDTYPPYTKILESCKKFLPDLANLRIIEQHPLRVGIRPFRKRGLRLEFDPENRIIHNYGHGGAGVLLSWGCAQEVCHLVDSLQP